MYFFIFRFDHYRNEFLAFKSFITITILMTTSETVFKNFPISLIDKAWFSHCISLPFSLNFYFSNNSTKLFNYSAYFLTDFILEEFNINAKITLKSCIGNFG